MPVDIRLTDVPTMTPGRGYSHAVTTTSGPLAFISGQVAWDETGAVVGVGDLAAQTRQSVRNMHAVLRSLSADWPDVVKLTWFVLDATQAQVIRDVRDEFLRPALGEHPNPASSLVQISGLVGPELLVEVEAVVALH